MALIHVIIPVYNAIPFLRDAVHSVLDQPCKDIEIVLVDDGSTDGSSALCDELAAKENRISVIHQKNQGVSAARNKGIEAVLGKDTGYIAFLDADDMWARNFLDENIRVYLSHKYDLIGFLSGRCNRTVTRHSLLSTMNEGVYAGGNTSIWLNARQHFGAGFYSIKTLERYNVRFPLGIKDNEDWMFAMQFRYLADEICLVNKLLYLYRNNIASVTHKRISAIPKYVPMIYGYLALDQLMGKYHNNQRGELKEGRAMAAVYIVDMFEEHYKQLGSKRELDKVMKDNPEFEKLILSPFAINRPDSGLRWQAMTAKPIVFIIKHNIKGVAKFIVQKTYRILMSIPPVARYLDRLRYPIII